MLSIGNLGLGQQRYYEQQVAHGRDDYYSGRGEAPGEWTGAGAHELGLHGRVSAAQFNALLAGRDPRNPEDYLRASNSQPDVAALDLTFSAPKSVSVLFAVAPAEVSAALVDAHEEAVRAALEYLEDEAVFVRRGKGGARFEHAGGLIAAAYRHRMSRALDPQLHTHVVAANLARGQDGRYTALHHPSLYRAARTAGYLYQTHLRAEVRDRLGLEWGPVFKGAAELRELPTEVLRAFSQRRAQVQAAIEQREIELGRALTRSERATWGAVATRDRKQYGIDTHSWREEITARADEHGLDSERVAQITRSGELRLQHRGVAVDGTLQDAGAMVGEEQLGKQLAGPVGLTERANTFDAPAVLREFAAAAVQGARMRTVRDQAARFAAREDVLETTNGTLTSSDLVEHERALIDSALGRAGEGVGEFDDVVVHATLVAAARPLNGDQVAAVLAVTTSGNGVDVIEALAGTGKTYTAGVLGEVYRRAGYNVIGVAPTGRAARELSERAGVPARTLDSRLLSLERGEALPERLVIVFDEAAVAATRQSQRFLSAAERAGAKVIAIGDPGQLTSVQAGGWLRAVGQRLGAVRLTEVMRQRDGAERRALSALHDGIPDRWLDWAQQAGRVEVLVDDTHALLQAVGEWAQGVTDHGPAESVMIARDNDTRRALNQLARQHRQQAGQLGEALTYGPVTIAVGDRVICRHNERDLDVDNGTLGTVRHVHAGGIVLETDAHTVRELPAGYVADHVEHAYALTGHGMQGATVEQAVVIASPHELSRGWSYTALSRGRGQTRLLIRDSTNTRAREREDLAPSAREPRREPAAVLRDVARRMLQRDDQDLAIDQLPVAGRADDPRLARATMPVQERGAEQAEPPLATPGERDDLQQLQQQLSALRAQLAALPTRELAQLEDLDGRAITLTERRDQLRDALAVLPAIRQRFGHRKDRYLPERARLTSALAGAEEQLQRVLTDRATLARHVGEPQPVREERDGLQRAIEHLQHQHTLLRDELAERELAGQPQWLASALGERPQRPSHAARWDRAARALAHYRVEHHITDQHDALGHEPANGPQREDYRRAQRAREAIARELTRDPPGLELDT